MNWFLLAFISAVFSAASAVSEKKALSSLDALIFSFAVSIATLFLSVLFFFNIHLANISQVSFFVLLFKTFLNASAFLCVMFAIKNLEISEALPLLALSPGLVAVAGVIFINDSLTLVEWFGIFLMVIGAYVLELRKDNKSFFDPFKTLFHFSKYSYVFIALLLFTVTSILDRILLKKFNLPPFEFMALQQFFYAIFFFVAVLIYRKGFVTTIKSINKNIFYVIVLVSVFTVVYRFTQIEATKLAPAALVLSVKRLSVLMAVVFGGRLFSEENLTRRIIAVVIILVGTAFLAL